MTEKVIPLYRLDTKVFQQLKKQLPIPLVDNSTSEHKAGFLLGIQYALSKLEEGFVVDK